MCNRFRSVVGKEWKPGDELPLELAGGETVQGVWAGFATREKLKWWLRQHGNQLAQGEEVAEVAERADDTREVIWGPVPRGARLIFVLAPPPPGKLYRLARMLTTAANENQVAYFRHGRYPVLGSLSGQGEIRDVAPQVLEVRDRPPPAQGELF